MKWLAVVVPLLLASLAWTFDLVRVKGRSMEPSLCDGDLAVVFVRQLPRASSRTPLEKVVLLAQRPEELILKRIVAVGGDRIRLEHGGLVRNGEPVAESYACGADYFETWPYGSHEGAQASFKVPAGEVFVMGDNRTSSSDSRVFGSISMSSLRGTVAMTLPTLRGRQTCQCGAARQGHPGKVKE